MNTIKIKTDKPVVVIPIDEYEGMKETIEILSSHPGIIKELQEEKKKIDKGQYDHTKNLRKIMADGMNV